MQRVLFITHGDVLIDANVPVPDWGLSAEGVRKHTAFNTSAATHGLTGVYSSNERKAVEGAQILATHLGLTVQRIEALHENDRSATGFLPPAEFELVADAFFGSPNTSIRGWERAIDAQSRIAGAVRHVLEMHGTNGDIAIVAHGGVGTLFLCKLMGVEISRRYDQPRNGGGNYYVFGAENLNLIHGWKPLDE